MQHKLHMFLGKLLNQDLRLLDFLYLIQKYYEFKGDTNEKIEIVVPKEGMQFQSIIYFIIFLFFLSYNFFLNNLV